MNDPSEPVGIAIEHGRQVLIFELEDEDDYEQPAFWCKVLTGVRVDPQHGPVAIWTPFYRRVFTSNGIPAARFEMCLN